MRMCPECGGDSTVLDSRQSDITRRRRCCVACGHRWSTAEMSLKEYRALEALRESLAKSRRELQLAENKLSPHYPKQTIDDARQTIAKTRSDLRALETALTPDLGDK